MSVIPILKFSHYHAFLVDRRHNQRLC